MLHQLHRVSGFGILTALMGLAFLVPPETAEAVGPSKPSKPEAKVTWTTLFDGKTLKNWKSADFGDEGKVLVKDGGIVLEKGKLMTGIVYDKKDFPKMDYEVTLEAKRTDGEDFFCTTTFPIGEAYCSFVVAGWRSTVVGLSNIDGSNASENETNTSMTFKNDQWYRVRIRVTKNRIQTWIDKERMVNFDTTDRKLSLHIACLPCRPFGVAAYDSSAVVRDIRVRKLDAAETK